MIARPVTVVTVVTLVKIVTLEKRRKTNMEKKKEKSCLQKVVTKSIVSIFCVNKTFVTKLKNPNCDKTQKLKF